MAENKDQGMFDGPMKTVNDNSRRMADDVSQLVGAWTSAGTEMFTGVTRIASNLAIDVVGNSVSRAASDFADTVKSSSDKFTESYDSSSSSSSSTAKK